MRHLRAIFSAVLAVVFLTAANSCLLATVFAGSVDACCETESAPEPAPCPNGDCAPCATLESGVNLSAHAPLTVPAPVISEDVLLSELLRARMWHAVMDVDRPVVEPERRPAYPWCDVVKTALPVRGPSAVS